MITSEARVQTLLFQKLAFKKSASYLPLPLNMHRERTEGQHSDKGAEGGNSEEDRGPAIRTIHAESGSNRLRTMTLN